VQDEFVRELEGRIGDDGLDAGRQSVFEEKIDATFGILEAVADEIGCQHVMTGGAQHPHDRAWSARRFPNSRRKILNSQQRFDRANRRLIGVIAAIGETVAQRVI
jgi:hypothetical protein